LNVAGVVAALAAEARALGPVARTRDGRMSLTDGTLVAVSGIGCEAAAHAAARLIESGASALVSWGMAGALDPDLPAGAVCVPSEIVALNGPCFSTAWPWRETFAAIAGAQRRVAAGRLLTSPLPIDSVAAKDQTYRATGAAAVDMESWAVAQVAAAHDLPFIAVRVIVDTAYDVVPRTVAAASRAGQVRIGRLVGGLLQSPGEIAPLLRLARRYRVAMRSLMAVAVAVRGAGALVPPDLGAVAPSRSGLA
jgi:adenosylhomocysteine nucleosidase